MGWRLLHWGPILALVVISAVSTCSILCTLQWWPPFQTFWGAAHGMLYSFWLGTTLYNFFCATFGGPGHVPLEWRPATKEESKCLQYCIFCEGYKAPRSHHCRKCGRCVMKMDHHCPWINNCVGHGNHKHFTQFLFFAPAGCIHSLFVIIPSMYRALHRHIYITERITDVPLVLLTPNSFIFCTISSGLAIGVTVAVGILLFIQRYYIYYGDGTEPMVHLTVNSFIACMFACGLAIGVLIAVGGLCFVQVRSIIKNETGIESWIRDKADYRERGPDEEPEFIYPYHLGRWENWKLVFHLKPRPELNGIWWPVVEGCNQYTLTIEQIMQKKEKQERSVIYLIKENYSGSIFPITKGFRVCCWPPCTDEPRIKLDEEDRVLVSRWKKRWLYGEKIPESCEIKGKDRIRGWFPRKCAVEVIGDDEKDKSVEENNHIIDRGVGDNAEIDKKND